MVFEIPSSPVDVLCCSNTDEKFITNNEIMWGVKGQFLPRHLPADTQELYDGPWVRLICCILDLNQTPDSCYIPEKKKVLCSEPQQLQLAVSLSCKFN
jgi:hypothetical protein